MAIIVKKNKKEFIFPSFHGVYTYILIKLPIIKKSLVVQVDSIILHFCSIMKRNAQFYRKIEKEKGNGHGEPFAGTGLLHRKI
ncbi:hypothetical protein ACFOU2_19410 [Bacillus songklensis]|uniref:Uncharacterized protein n=1 Tax=Bacillus songklensis TaxID=1069116 RepID=A0ABV8B5E6_9BACI